MSLDELLKRAKDIKMSPKQKEDQRRSFAFGNSNIENARISRKSLNAVADAQAALRAHTPSPVARC